MPKNRSNSRKNKGKPKLSYILDFPNTSAEVANVLEMGHEKYSRYGFRDGAPMSEIMDSTMRHIQDFYKCEDLDKESGQSHLAHAIADLMILLEIYHIHGGAIDDRDDRCL